MFCQLLFLLLVNNCLSEIPDWKSVDLTSDDLPDNIADLRRQVNITDKKENINGINTYLQTADPVNGVKPSGEVVLLLHGAAFTSQTWVDRVPTIATLAALGHRVIAVDLPGYGKTNRQFGLDRGQYLADLIDVLTPNVKPVIVTPSMSGGFIFPMLKEYPNKISGWVPVAPVSSNGNDDFYKNLDIPTMIVYGERDFGASRVNNRLSKIPTSTKPQELPDSSHPAYLDQPDLWHKLLANFLRLLE